MQFRAFQSEGVKKQGFSQTIFSFAKKDIFKLSIFQISKVLCGKIYAFFPPLLKKLILVIRKYTLKQICSIYKVNVKTV